MKQKLLAAVLAAALALGCVTAYADKGLGDSWEQILGALAEAWSSEGDPDDGETAPESEESWLSQILASAQASGSSSSSLSITVDESTGGLTVERPSMEETPMGDAGVWTIFVYLCGSDLETDAGSATWDLMEMVSVEGSDHVRFVVETGGARRWYNNKVVSDRNDRFLIQNGSITKVDEVTLASMGETSTLADFLTWGIESYASEKMGLILWDHGGGSISGVCFDERDGYDSLSLRELDAALLSAYEIMTDRFEFIGFDACLMGTVETANILASYADYMYASQESEPGSGWDYAAIGEYLSAHPEADGAALGQIVCDSFYESSAAAYSEEIATLSVVDLRRVDELILCFNTFAESMYAASQDTSVLTSMVRGIWSADNFGGNNKTEGYTNMVDLGALIAACAEWSDGAEEALAALGEAVVYSVAGSDHKNASGLSIFYPLELQGSRELSIFSDLCISPYYLSFVDRQSRGSVSLSEAEDYDNSTWFDEDGLWSLVTEYIQDAETNYYTYEEETDEYWDYADDYAPTGESSLITFDTEPQLDENGNFFFVLSQEGWEYAADVYAMVFELSGDGEDLIELGETCDVEIDWDRGYVEDYFDGYWLSLPDGQNLALYIVDVTEDYILYTSPILLNGEATHLRIRQSWDGTATAEGTWNGIYDTGAAEREIVQLKDGDVILPLYYSYNLDDLSEGMYGGEEYTVEGTVSISYELMESGDYFYSFCIDDIYGDYYLTDVVTFSVESDGTVYFYAD